jgi:hypothetical protein
LTRRRWRESLPLMRGFAALVLVAVLSGCAAAESPTPPLATLAPGEVALPEYLAEVGGAPQLCAGVAFVGYSVVVHGSPDDPALTWIVFGNDGHRENLLWPPGYRARFTPSLVVLDPTGQIVAREGEYATGGCPMLPGGTLIDLPTKTQPLGVNTPTRSATPVPPTSSPAPGYVAVEGLPITVLANEDAEALFSEVETCVSGVGYTVMFPASWYTNAAIGDTPACSWFGPEPFNVSIRPVAVNPPPPDGVWIGMSVVDGSAGYTTITPIYLSESVGLDGYEGSRAEFGPSTLDEIESRPEYRAYWYVIPFERVGPTFIAETDLDLADDYPLAKAVLDRIMATITFQAS